MYTWVLILVVNMMIIGAIGIVMMKRTGYHSIKPLLFILIIALIFGGIWFGAQNHLSERTIQAAEPVIQWEQCPTADKNIYYDSQDGTYFFVTYDDWEFFPMFHRNYLDPIQAAEFVELSSRLEQYDINDMLLIK